jgi:hypothetical protein
LNPHKFKIAEPRKTTPLMFECAQPDLFRVRISAIFLVVPSMSGATVWIVAGTPPTK